MGDSEVKLEPSEPTQLVRLPASCLPPALVHQCRCHALFELVRDSFDNVLVGCARWATVLGTTLHPRLGDLLFESHLLFSVAVTYSLP